ncbi:hypothetical protein B0T17DRAFT_618984 [Bombardia bombarda]|uniref:NTF2-like protein n=1 Tax=Bombardia bombarda TaxID=252184 RepID=A0AA39WN03_9PEZI|nr:hypothetical protein B0T17DRAFT_618984 [Bombardia bombarda]
MALQAAYKQFLAAPSSSALAANASLHYITTTTSILGAAEIIKHLGAQRNQVKTKKEEALYAVEGQNAIVIEAETSLEFTTGGGAYLPGLDDNFLIDRIVHFPIMHVVTFTSQGTILQIRQSWDQGSLLRQLEVIGKTGRNWPIRDGKDQIGLVTRCIKSGGSVTAPAPAPAVPNPISHARGTSTNILRDPHASLALFAPREESENLPEAVISPYAGRRPRQRSFTEILGDEPVDEPNSPSRGRERSQSPSKGFAPKAGATKHLQPIRLFENDENGDSAAAKNSTSPERPMRVNPTKYQHFDFVDGSDPQDAPKPGRDLAQKSKSKHDTNWSFDDFNTPQKSAATRTMTKGRDVRHWGNENDVVEPTPAKRAPAGQVKGRINAESHFDFVEPTPAKKAPAHQAKGRINTESHFDFADEDPSAEPRLIGRPRGAAHNSGFGLYDNNLYNEDGSAPTPGPGPLGNITNMKNRGTDFESHFSLTDVSPSSNGPKPEARISDDRKKAVRMMESNWSAYDESPTSQKENSNPKDPNKVKKAGADDRGIVIAGDGMGGKKGSGRAWAIGDDSDEGPDSRGAIPGKKQPPQVKSSNFWDY